MTIIDLIELREVNERRALLPASEIGGFGNGSIYALVVHP